MKHKLALIGFGNVGQGLATILAEKRAALARTHGFEFEIVAVSDIQKGSALSSKGIDPGELLKRPEAVLDKSLKKDALAVIRECDATVVVEITYTDLTTGEPATSHVKAAFAAGKHVVTTNKGPLALHFRELGEMAAAKKVQFRYEGTVMAGTPVISFGMTNLAGCDFSEIRGIFNGTIRNWKDMGGKDSPITVVSREAGSGTRSSFEQIVKNVALSKDALIQDSNGTIRETVANDANAIGYLSHGLVNEKVKAVKVDGAACTTEDIASARYALVRPIFLLTKGAPAGAAKDLSDYILSPEGQKPIHDLGLIPAQ